MNLPAFVHHSPALQVTATSAPFDYGRALSLREMARHYTEMPKYLLAPEVAGLLHYLPDWNQHAFINTLWNTGARLNEALALRRRDFHLNEEIPHVVIRTAKQRRTAGGRPKKGRNGTPGQGLRSGARALQSHASRCQGAVPDGRAARLWPRPRVSRQSAAHQRFDLVHAHRYAARDQLAALVLHHGVVLDANAQVVEGLGHAGGRAHIQAGLDGQHHARAQDAAGAVHDDFTR